jgi:hypothetical protein
MNKRLHIVTLLLAFILLAGCSSAQTETPAATNVPSTPTVEIFQASLDPFEVDGFSMKIIFVHLGEDDYSKNAPFNLSAGETMLSIRVQPLSVDLMDFSEEERDLFRVSVSDENGVISKLGPVVLSTSTDYIFQFPVSETSETFYLNFPNGDVYDLTPLMP